MPHDSLPAPDARAAGAARDRATRSFHFWLGWCFLLLVLLGFGKSFYLRPLFDNRDITLDVYLHGAILTAWFALFALQVTLIDRAQRARHRALGRGGAVVAVLVVLTSLPVAYLRPSRLVANPPPGYDFAADIPHLAIVVIGNTGFLALFSVFFALAIAMRRRAAAHKRLMTLASYCILGPAIGRLETLWGTAGETSTTALTAAVGLGIPLALIAHDLINDRRVHRVNAIGVPVVLLWLACNFTVAGALGEPLIRWLATAL